MDECDDPVNVQDIGTNTGPEVTLRPDFEASDVVRIRLVLQIAPYYFAGFS